MDNDKHTRKWMINTRVSQHIWQLGNSTKYEFTHFSDPDGWHILIWLERLVVIRWGSPVLTDSYLKYVTDLPVADRAAILAFVSHMNWADVVMPEGYGPSGLKGTVS